MIIVPNELIVTNAHTVQKGEHILVALKNKKVFETQILATYPENDIAIFKIPGAKDLPALGFSEKDPIELNSKIFTIKALIIYTVQSHRELSTVFAPRLKPKRSIEKLYDLFKPISTYI